MSTGNLDGATTVRFAVDNLILDPFTYDSFKNHDSDDPADSDRTTISISLLALDASDQIAVPHLRNPGDESDGWQSTDDEALLVDAAVNQFTEQDLVSGSLSLFRRHGDGGRHRSWTAFPSNGW